MRSYPSGCHLPVRGLTLRLDLPRTTGGSDGQGPSAASRPGTLRGQRPPLPIDPTPTSERSRSSNPAPSMPGSIRQLPAVLNRGAAVPMLMARSLGPVHVRPASQPRRWRSPRRKRAHRLTAPACCASRAQYAGRRGAGAVGTIRCVHRVQWQAPAGRLHPKPELEVLALTGVDEPAPRYAAIFSAV